jgi:pyrimidine-nucleoside phosphorylase
MRAVELIQAKRDGSELSSEQIRFLIDGFVAGEIPDYQMSAWAMAVFFRGLTLRETAALTAAMIASGETIDLRDVRGVKVDKHSTGGVGDTTTLVLAPLVATLGVPVAKMSGRGLGHTGGTIDKLESIPGFQVELTREQFIRQVNDMGVSVISQTAKLAPADKLLYALRDVTATVESIPLIAASIMSKKIASGADAIVLDVKTGSGAFMKTIDESIRLAQTMVAIGHELGRETIAIISNMNQPLGNAIGNALEVREALALLRGDSGVSLDLLECCLILGAHMVVLGKQASTVDEAKEMLRLNLYQGLALNKFAEFAVAQGGAAELIHSPNLLPRAPRIEYVHASEKGYVSAIQTESLGIAAMRLGAGRATKQDQIDLAVGLKLLKRIGDPVVVGEAIVEIHAQEHIPPTELTEIIRIISEAYFYQSQPISPLPLIHAIVSKQGVEYV